MEKEIKTTCTGCIYWRRFMGSGANLINACHYLLDTDHMRGCPVDYCTRKTTELTVKG